MRCNGAGLARFHEWKVSGPGPLIANVTPRRIPFEIVTMSSCRDIASFRVVRMRAAIFTHRSEGADRIPNHCDDEL